MKNVFLILIILAAAAFGYYIVTKVDDFIEENQRLIAAENRKGQQQVRIAAESPILLDSVASALESCSDADPHIGFFLSSGKADRLLEKLLDEQIDILLLTDEHDGELGQQYESVMIPYRRTAARADALSVHYEDPDEEVFINVVWKKGIKSKNRDRVIIALENEHC